jgi:hypothetical protein
MKKNLALLFTIFFAHFIEAQTNFISGYIIDVNGAKIEGLIDYENWDRNPSSFLFKKTATSETQVYSLTSQDITECHFKIEQGEEIYLKRTVLMNRSSQDYATLSDTAGPYMVLDSAFLKVLEKGKVNLYGLKANYKRPQFFIETTNSSITELIIKEFIIQDSLSPRKIGKRSDKYKQQLAKVMFENKNIIMDEIPGLPFNEGSIRDIVQKFNKGIEGIPTYTYNENNKKNEFGLFGGVGFGSGAFAYLSRDPSQIPGSYSGSTQPLLGFFYSIDVARYNHSWFIYNDIHFRSFDAKGTFTYPLLFASNILVYKSVQIKYSIFAITSSCKYKYHLNPTTSITFMGGFLIGSMTSGTSTSEESFTSFTGNPTSNSTISGITSDFKLGNTFGIGFEKNRFEIDLRYDTEKIFTNRGDRALDGFFVNCSYTFSHRVKPL